MKMQADTQTAGPAARRCNFQSFIAINFSA